MILTIGNKFKRLNLKFRKDGKGKSDVDAFDFSENFTEGTDFMTDSLFTEITISNEGYIFKPNQLYKFHGDGVLNSEEWFNKTLKQIGVTFIPLNNREYILNFKYPVKLYNDSSIFFNI